MKKLFLLVGISLLLTSCGASKTETPFVVQRISKAVQQEASTDVAPSYTADEVSIHDTKNDCWLILDNGVYDVTSFIPRHPGGDKILRGCGKDATEMFAQHPDSAKTLKEEFKIGNLAE